MTNCLNIIFAKFTNVLWQWIIETQITICQNMLVASKIWPNSSIFMGNQIKVTGKIRNKNMQFIKMVEIIATTIQDGNYNNKHILIIMKSIYQIILKVLI